MKKIVFFLASVFFISFFAKTAVASDQFKTDVTVNYDIDATGATTVIHNVSLENKTSDFYATSYSLTLVNIDPVNPKATYNALPLPLELVKDGERTTLKVKFSDQIIGKSAKRNFAISFEEPTVANKTGEVWEINIPKLGSSEAFDSYSLVVRIPYAFGNLAYMSPEADNHAASSGKEEYYFSKEKITQTGITAGFGDFQVFNFKLSYHLENPLNKAARTEISIPPDTDLQKVYYESLVPKPNNVYIDEDGNWVGEYVLKARQRVDVTALGSVQIFSGQRPFGIPLDTTLKKNLEEKEYWETSDPKIKELAKIYNTPEAIYNYVSTTLKYNYDRVAPNIDRLGAKQALQDTNNAICMEFTDLFIAISRAAGIPAREVNGYAYTDNPEVEPLSLVADVLHAWPEYWDTSKKAWIPVDPTWASTTGGIDFFHKFDLRHFAFVMHGVDSTKPFPPGSYKLGPNPQKDVFVNFGDLPVDRQSKALVKVNETVNIPFISEKFNVSVENPGPVALYDQDVQILFDNKLNSSKNIQVLPPFGVYTFEVISPFSLFGNKTPTTISIQTAGSLINIPTSKNNVILYSLIIFFLAVFCLIIFILYRLKGKRIAGALRSVKLSIKSKYDWLTNKFKKNQG